MRNTEKAFNRMKSEFNFYQDKRYLIFLHLACNYYGVLTKTDYLDYTEFSSGRLLAYRYDRVGSNYWRRIGGREINAKINCS